MKKTFYFAAAAALLMASSAAQAGDGYSFNIDGQKMRIEAPRNCNSLSCISVTKDGTAIDMKNMNFKGRKSDDDNVATSSPPPAPLAPPAPLPAANNVPPAPAPAADTGSERLTGLPSTPPARAASTVEDQILRSKKLDEANVPTSAPVANAAAPAPPMRQEAAAAATTPLGLWQTEDNKGNNKGNVRVEQCGANLCGYGEKNGEESKELVLINMKPSSDNSKWTGRIHDPSSGKDYDSTVAMEGPNQLKVQGCALGGMFCGGTTWKRIK